MKEGQGFARRVTIETLKEFERLLSKAKEKAAKEKPEEEEKEEKGETETQGDPALKKAEALFKGTSLKVTIPFKPPVVRIPGKKVVLPKKPGPLKWQKTLAASDVQSQPGHPTGGVRLTQARFKVRGRAIDQTTYFRNIVFDGLPWNVVKQNPWTEAVSVKFDITILGKRLKIHPLEVRHKPSGEAGQRNYTTILTWKHLGRRVRKMKLVGKTLKLYAPPKGATEPFFIEIS